MQRTLRLLILGPPRIELIEDNGKNCLGGKIPDRSVALLTYAAMKRGLHKDKDLKSYISPGADEPRQQPRGARQPPRSGRPMEDKAVKDPAGNFRQARRGLGPLKSFLIEDREDRSEPKTGFDFKSNHWIDALAFEKLVHKALEEESPEQLSAATELYRGEFLEGIFGEYHEEFIEWLEDQRDHYKSLLPDAYNELASYFARKGSIGAAIETAEDWVKQQPRNEKAWILRLQLLGSVGFRREIDTVHDEYRKALEQHKDIKESSEVNELIRRIKAREPIILSTTFNFEQRAFIIGREHDLRTISNLLINEEINPLVLIGPAGVGTSTLANTVTHELRGNFKDGVCHVPLEEISSADMLFPFVASILEKHFKIDKPRNEAYKTFVKNCLKDKKFLLLLDDFDHVRSAWPEVMSIAKNSNKKARILLTCRDLDFPPIDRETPAKIYRVAPLAVPLPESEKVYRPETLQDFPSIKLFLHCIHEVNRTTIIEKDGVEAIGKICRLLGGLPGAIQLLASTIDPHDCTDQALCNLAEDLESRLSTEPAHSIFEAIVDYSYRFRGLTKDEQEILKDLSVFAGNFSLDALWQVRGESPYKWLLQWHLQRLCAKSFIQVGKSNGENRYSLLQITKEYLRKLLSENKQKKEELQYRLVRYFVDKRDIQERANITEAWQWLFQKQEQNPHNQEISSLILQYAETAAIYPLHWRNSYIRHIRQLRAVLQAMRTSQPTSDNEAQEEQRFLLLGVWAIEEKMEKALDLYESYIDQLDDYSPQLPRVLLGIGNVYDYLAQFSPSFATLARLSYRDALEQAGNDQYIICCAHKYMGDSDLLWGEVHDAIGRYSASLKRAKYISEETLKNDIISWVQRGLGLTYMRINKLEDAEQCFRDSLSLIDVATDQRTAAIINWCLGKIEVEHKRFDKAIEFMCALPELMAEERYPGSEKYLAQLVAAKKFNC